MYVQLSNSGENRRIYYTTLNLDGQNEQTLDVENWSSQPTELKFPNKITRVGFGVVDPKQLPVVKLVRGTSSLDEPVRLEEIDLFASSTPRLTENVPFQVFSHQKYIYVFRQAINKDHPDAWYVTDAAGEPVLDFEGNPIPVVNETLLADRFVFVKNELRMYREVRYRRSRSKFRPLNPKNTLGAMDMDDRPFFEPTQFFDFVRHLKSGRFSVLQLPTQVADIKRWQLFTHNSWTDRIDAYSIERSHNGWFNTLGSYIAASENTNVAESALQLDVVNDYISLGTLSTGGSFSIEMWIRPREKSGDIPDPLPNQMLLSLSDDNSESPLRFGYYADYLGLTLMGAQIPSVNAQRFRVSQAIADWHHLALIVETVTSDAVRVKAYQNGELVWSEELPAMVIGDLSNRVWQLGRQFDGEQGRDYFEGSLDEFRIWNRALNEDEIADNLSHRLNGNELGLLAYRRFDEGIGSNLYDQTDNAFHATMHGMFQGEESWIASAAPLSDSRGINRTSFGYKNRTSESGLSALLYRYALGLEDALTALQFDGVDDCIEVPAVSMSNRSFTLEFWAKREPGNFDAFFSTVLAQERPEENQL